MENDWDLELSHEINDHPNFQPQIEVEPDFMLQPITTQDKFNLNNKKKQSPTPKTFLELNSSKQFHSLPEGTTNEGSLKDSQELAQEARKFRQYLNDKVQQLKKSKEKINSNLNTSPQTKSKMSNLRKIINKEELKSKQHFEQKTKPGSENTGFSKQPNLVNKTAVEIKKTNQTSASSVGAYKNEKRFSNSQSSLAKNVQKKDLVHSKNTTVTDIKKSLNLDQNSKTPKLPELTPKLKIPFPQKNEPNSTQQKTQKRKSTIEQVVSKDLMQKQKRRTPESNNSFRIKRTSNAQNNQANAQPSQQKISLDIKKSNDGSLKTIEKDKEKEREKQSSPIHQGKNRKMREDFIRFNEEQRKIQQEILKNHQTSKQNLDAMMKKYQLSSNAYQKYNIKKQAQFPNQPQLTAKSPKKNHSKQSRINPTQNQLPQESIQKQSTLKKEERRNKFLDEELQKINSLLKARQHNIKKNESRVEKNPLMQFMKTMPEDILEESDEDQYDKVEQLPGQNGVKQDPKYDTREFSSTYSSVMTEMKNKKWGLKQRITFETHRDQNDVITGVKKSIQLNESNIPVSNKKLQQNSRLPEPRNEQQNSEPYSKIEVNSRLKNLLLD